MAVRSSPRQALNRMRTRVTPRRTAGHRNRKQRRARRLQSANHAGVTDAGGKELAHKQGEAQRARGLQNSGSAGREHAGEISEFELSQRNVTQTCAHHFVVRRV